MMHTENIEQLSINQSFRPSGAESLWSGGLPYAASSNNLELGLLCVLVTLVLRLF